VRGLEGPRPHFAVKLPSGWNASDVTVPGRTLPPWAASCARMRGAVRCRSPRPENPGGCGCAGSTRRGFAGVDDQESAPEPAPGRSPPSGRRATPTIRQSSGCSWRSPSPLHWPATTGSGPS
jgi:hypothetical protein